MSRTYPVVEMFGPTVQGEGPAQGERCWFLRLGGCDYRCSWCDSMRAVDPAEVRKAPRLTPFQIIAGLWEHGMAEGDLLVVSGGNPALHHLMPLVAHLRERDVRVHVETQGTVFRPWLNSAELVVVSPKPPSAFGAHPAAWQKAESGLRHAESFTRKALAPWALKVVAFDDGDLEWAVRAHRVLVAQAPPPVEPVACYLSAGTDQEPIEAGRGPAVITSSVIAAYRWLADRHIKTPELGVYRIGLQAHVLAWPGEQER